VLGGDVREYEVILDPRAALTLKLNPDDVAYQGLPAGIRLAE